MTRWLCSVLAPGGRSGDDGVIVEADDEDAARAAALEGWPDGSTVESCTPLT